MKAEIINPFLTECANIFKEVAGIDLTYNGTVLKDSPASTKNVVVILGITGDLKGSVAISLDKEFAKVIASNMMGGMEVTELDELAKSAVSELCNMIMGRVATTFSSKGINTDITPPSLLTGEGIILSAAHAPLLSIKFIYSNYKLEFDISVKDK